MKQVLFTVGGEEFGTDIFNVEGIERDKRIVRIPTAPAYIAGLIDLRGEAIPVFDLRVRFGFPKAEEGLLIISKMRGSKVAIAVDEVKEIVEADDSEVISAPNLVRNGATEYVSKVTNVKGHMFISLDFDAMLSDDEVKAVVDMVQSQND